MSTYGVADAARILQVKAHVIRYWEKEIPLIQPKRDSLGKRHYSDHDIKVFLRLKYLLYEKHFTVEGARDELFSELSGEGQDLKIQIDALRSDLLRICKIVQKDKPVEAVERND